MEKTIRNRMMKDFFEMGFEEIESQQYLVGDAIHLYQKKDFAPGGSMEKFSNYTVDRFEHEFCVMLSFR